MLTITYQINFVVKNQLTDEEYAFNKTFDHALTMPDNELYDNFHIISDHESIRSFFVSEVSELADSLGINPLSLTDEEFGINSLSEEADVYFETDDPSSNITFSPMIKCYVKPKYGEINPPELKGAVYDEHTIIWSWNDDGQAHYLVTQPLNFDDPEADNSEYIIATLPIGMNSYIETGLEPNTSYTRRIIAYNSEQTSRPGDPVTALTETEKIDIAMSKYNTDKEYSKSRFLELDEDGNPYQPNMSRIEQYSALDEQTDDSEREYIDERMEAFHSGIGDFNDLKVYKQMDSDFYQKFKAYFEVIGHRTEREKTYEQVGFNYKICLEAINEIQEQEGEVTFDVCAYPMETVSIKDYMWAWKPVTVYARLHADVLLRRKIPGHHQLEVQTMHPVWEPVYEQVDHVFEEFTWSPALWMDITTSETTDEPGSGHWEGGGDSGQVEITIKKKGIIVLSLDCSGSMLQTAANGHTRIANMKKGVIGFLNKIHNKFKKPKRLKFVIVTWAMTAQVAGPFDYDNAKDYIEKIRLYKSGDDAYYELRNGSSHNGEATSWYLGFSAGPKNKSKIDGVEVVGRILFTDGFPNFVTSYSQGLWKGAVKADPESKCVGWLGNNKLNDNIGKCKKFTNYIADAIEYAGWPICVYIGPNVHNHWDSYGGFNGNIATVNGKTYKCTNLNLVSFKRMANKNNYIMAHSPADGSGFRDDTIEDDFFKYLKKILNERSWISSSGGGGKTWVQDPPSSSGGTTTTTTHTLVHPDGWTDGNGVFYSQEEVEQMLADGTLVMGDNGPGHYVGTCGMANATQEGGVWYGHNNPPANMDWGSVSYHLTLSGWEFLGWEYDTDPLTINCNFSIDQCKWASVIVPSTGKMPFWFTFTNENTPIAYDRREQRAIIPESSIIADYNFNNITANKYAPLQDPKNLADGSRAIMWRTKNGISYQVNDLYEEVMESVKENSLWNEGYNLTINTSQGDPVFFVSGVWIEDTYVIADEDDPVDLNTLNFERNYLGSVNVYTKLNRMETDTFGDDVFYIRKYDEDDGDTVTIQITDYSSVYMNGYKETDIVSVFYGCGTFRNIKLTMNSGHWYGFDVLNDNDEIVATCYDENKATHDDDVPLTYELYVYTEKDARYKIKVYECEFVSHQPDKYTFTISMPGGTVTRPVGERLWISGYTDSLIFDGTRYVSTRLNGAPAPYGHPSEVIVNSASVTDASYSYNDFLFNRNNENVVYTESPNTSHKVSHVLDILEIGNDVEIQGATALISQGDWEEFPAPIDHDIVAAIKDDKCYRSPILNYRFNLEDPDAKVQLYEIIPDADENNKYPHVVIVHIYYARNINCGDQSTPAGTAYIAAFGDSPIATTSSPFMWDPLKEGANYWGSDNPKYVTSYIWFYASPMKKEVEYYDELPKGKLDYMYGMVNGRYRTDNPNGRHDLRVDAPKFNIPNTVIESTIRIYASIMEFYPSNALVQYKWDNPWQYNDDVTQVNGDYITFSSDSISWKDIIYKDLLETIVFESQELNEQGNYTKIFEIKKPLTARDNYTSWSLNVNTDNSDVIATRYPQEIIFDEETGLANVGVTFKGVVNATTRWSPRIHNGYYYINQHEYFAYSEFNVEADFEKYTDDNFKTVEGLLEIDVIMRHKAGPVEEYSVTKNTRSELLQDEEKFVWVDGEGLRLKPVIDGVYYKRYFTYTYYSPVFHFPHILTSPGPIQVSYDLEDSSTLMPMYVRSYILEEGKWSDWEPFNNGDVPSSVPHSAAYQIKFDMQASCSDRDLEIEDYMCCYLDWKDDAEISEDGEWVNCYNIVAITDHLQVEQPLEKNKGVYTSKVIDMGCTTEIFLDIYASKKHDGCILYAFASDNPAEMQIENIVWHSIDDNAHSITGRYFRYRIEVGHGEKCYWLHKRVITKATDVIQPTLQSIRMTGQYVPEDIDDSIVNIESFKIKTTGEMQEAIPSVLDKIASDVLKKGFELNEIVSVSLHCNTSNIEIQYDSIIESSNPTENALDRPVNASAPFEVDIKSYNTPYIFAKHSLCGLDLIGSSHTFDKIEIVGTPQQYCPIVVETENGIPLTRVYGVSPESMRYEETHYIIDPLVKESTDIPEDEVWHDRHYIRLTRNDYDPKTVVVFLNDFVNNSYHIKNNLLIWDVTMPEYGDIVTVQYVIKNSFVAEINRDDINPENELTTITVYTDFDDELARMGKWIPDPYYDKDDPLHYWPYKQQPKYKVFFETDRKNNKFVAGRLSLNPIYRTDYSGFIYLTDEHTSPWKINAYCNPTTLRAGGYDKVDISFEVVDKFNNPCIECQIAIDCNYGVLIHDDDSLDHYTDMNGVIHVVYESAATVCNDNVTARVMGQVLNDNNVFEDVEISKTITISNVR